MSYDLPVLPPTAVRRTGFSDGIPVVEVHAYDRTRRPASALVTLASGRRTWIPMKSIEVRP